MWPSSRRTRSSFCFEIARCVCLLEKRLQSQTVEILTDVTAPMLMHAPIGNSLILNDLYRDVLGGCEFKVSDEHELDAGCFVSCQSTLNLDKERQGS